LGGTCASWVGSSFGEKQIQFLVQLQFSWNSRTVGSRTVDSVSFRGSHIALGGGNPFNTARNLIKHQITLHSFLEKLRVHVRVHLRVQLEPQLRVQLLFQHFFQHLFQHLFQVWGKINTVKNF
jgi:hypothetical protein